MWKNTLRICEETLSDEGNGMMEYIKLFWEDAPEGEPPVILYEVDTGHERLALRSIDVFADGHTRNIDGGIQCPCLGRGVPCLFDRESGI